MHIYLSHNYKFHQVLDGFHKLKLEYHDYKDFPDDRIHY